MPTPINGPVTSSNIFAASNAYGPADSSASISAMPEASDPLVSMVDTGDIGSSIAALVMMTQKELRKAARQDRDALYKAEESAQREELDAMEDSANAKFITGLTEGGLQLGSAGCSFASAGASVQSAQNGPKIDTLNTHPTAEDFKAAGEGLQAYGIVTKAVGGLFSDEADRDAKAAGNRAATFKRLAEGRADDVHDAEKSIDKAVEFLNQWLSGKAAASQAALHRA